MNSLWSLGPTVLQAFTYLASLKITTGYLANKSTKCRRQVVKKERYANIPKVK